MDWIIEFFTFFIGWHIKNLNNYKIVAVILCSHMTAYPAFGRHLGWHYEVYFELLQYINSVNFPFVGAFWNS